MRITAILATNNEERIIAWKLRRTVSGIDETLWNKVSGLAPGQALVSFPHMARPLLLLGRAQCHWLRP